MFILRRIIADSLATKDRFNAAMLKLTRGTQVEPLLLRQLSPTEAVYLQKFLDRLDVLKAKKTQVEAMPVPILVQTYTRMLTQFIEEVNKTLCLDPSYHQAKLQFSGRTLETNAPQVLAPLLAKVQSQYGEQASKNFQYLKEIHITQTDLENGRSLPEFGRVFIAQDISDEKKASVLVHENSHLYFYQQYAELIKNLDELILQVEHWENYENTFGAAAEYFRDGYFRFEMIPVARLLNEIYAHLQEFLYVVRFQLGLANMQEVRTIMLMSKELLSLVAELLTEVEPELAQQSQVLIEDIRSLEKQVQSQLAEHYHGKADNALLNLMAVVLSAQDFAWVDNLFLQK